MKKRHTDQIYYGYVPQSAGATVPAIQGVAVGGSLMGQVIMDSDSDFVWVAGSFIAWDPTAAADISNTVHATVQIVDTSDNSNVFFAPSQIRNVFGNAQLPFLLPRPLRFSAKTTLNVTVAILAGGAAHATDFYLLMHGIKDYTRGNVPLADVPA